MVSPASVPESSSLQTASLLPTALARSGIARQAVVPVLPVSVEDLTFGSMPFHCRGTATEAAVGYKGFRLRCDLRVRAGMHCALPRLQSGRSRAGETVQGPSVCLPHAPESRDGQPRAGWTGLAQFNAVALARVT